LLVAWLEVGWELEASPALGVGPAMRAAQPPGPSRPRRIRSAHRTQLFNEENVLKLEFAVVIMDHTHNERNSRGERGEEMEG
jgi:hypothetical protein